MFSAVLSATLLVFCGSACKARRPDSAALRADANDDAGPGLAPNQDAAASAKINAAPFDSAAIKDMAQELTRTVEQSLAVAGLDLPRKGAEGLALADAPPAADEPKSAADARKLIERITLTLAQARTTLASMKDGGFSPDSIAELEKMIGAAANELKQHQLRFMTLEAQEQLDAATKKQADDAKKYADERKNEQARLDKAAAEAQDKVKVAEKMERERLAKAAADAQAKADEARRKREAETSEARLIEKRNKEINEIRALVKQLYATGSSGGGNTCTISAWTTKSTFDLAAEGRRPWSDDTVYAYARKEIWIVNSSGDIAIPGGAGFKLSQSSAVYILIKFNKTACRSSFKGETYQFEFMGESTRGDSTYQLYGVMNYLNEFNVRPVNLGNDGVMFYRADVQLYAGSAESAFINPENRSKIFGLGGGDCKGIVTKSDSPCKTWDCKSIVRENLTTCDSWDCKAIVTGNSRLCDSWDCKAIVGNEPGRCDSKDCVAVISKNYANCP